MLEAFQNEVRDFVIQRSIAERSDSATFLIWFLEYIFGLDVDIAVSCVCDKENDKGIDAIFVDNLEEEIHIFQSKFKESNNRSIGDRLLRDFTGVKPWFESSDTVKSLRESTINAELAALIDDNEIIDIIDDYTCKYHFVINALKDHNTTEYAEVNKDTTIWCIEEIKKFYHQIKDNPFVIDTIKFCNIKDEEKIIVNDVGGNKIITWPILASEIITFKGIDDYTLFNKNVRYGLGNTRVNKSIIRTIQSETEKESFLLFHNGVSLVCESFDYNPEAEELEIVNYSVVNGAQSTITFYKNQTLLSDDVKLFIKVIQIGTDQEFSDQVTYYTNNQNSISMKDLRSNDKIQRRLVAQFEDLKKDHGINVTYAPKRGAAIPENDNPLYSDYAAQLITACYLKSPYNTHLKSSMFDSGYNTIFNRNIKAEHLYLYYRSHQILIGVLDQITDQRIARYGQSQHLLINILIQILSNHEETENIIHKPIIYFENQEAYNLLIKLLFESLIKVFNHSINDLNNDDDFVYKNYFRAKEKIETLRGNMLGLFDTSLGLSGRTYADICEEAGL